jgi:hypothetical protein
MTENNREDRCTCCASFCQHGLEGCPNQAAVEVTVSAKRGSIQVGSASKNAVCEGCWTLITINLPNIFGLER